MMEPRLGVLGLKEKVLMHDQVLTSAVMTPFALGDPQDIPMHRFGLVLRIVGACLGDRTLLVFSINVLTSTTASKIMRDSSMKYVLLAASATLLLGLFSPAVAQAQDRYGSDVPQKEASDNHVTIGIGAAVLPEFQASMR